MEKIINSQGINTNGWQPINYLTSTHPLLLVLFWLSASSFNDDFIYSENNLFLAGDVKRSLSGVRENEQSRNQKPKELGFKDCALHIRTRDLSNRGVAL